MTLIYIMTLIYTKCYLLILLILIGFNSVACSQSESSPNATDDSSEVYNSTDPFITNNSLGAGINLGNALEAPKEGEWGLVIREEYIQQIADAGFQSVRIPIRWNAHANNQPPYNIESSFFYRVDEVIGWILDRNLKVIINIHHYNELMDDPSDQRARFLSIWSQIAEHYREYSNDLLFEILNEPHGNIDASIWNAYLKSALNTVRKTNKERIVIVGPAQWGGIRGLQNLSLPDDDQQIIVTVHYYDPFQFTHQGAEWVGDESDQWLGTTWTGTSNEKLEIDTEFNEALDWAEVNNRPIHLGEFGAYEKAPMQSRIHWTEYVRESAEKRGFSWAYWEFGSGFGVYNRDVEEWREGLLKALLPNTPVVQ